MKEDSIESLFFVSDFLMPRLFTANTQSSKTHIWREGSAGYH
ncbi:hypothetical protein D035_4909 [Vibrio parahaemolyticus VP250]|nr:hypothetical protein D035_4909 [Vibrio parahaemolyticus VP250]